MIALATRESRDPILSAPWATIAFGYAWESSATQVAVPFVAKSGFSRFIMNVPGASAGACADGAAPLAPTAREPQGLTVSLSHVLFG